jgi:hypothetical protein
MSELNGIPNALQEESTPCVDCQWPDSRVSISVQAARVFDCFPTGVGKLPILAAKSYALLASPIGGARFPLQNGGLRDDIRFLHLCDDGNEIDVGPMLLQFVDGSGGARPSFLEANGWIYDDMTEHAAEVIQVSTTTGALLQRTLMLSISRPDIALNQSGFWLGQDTDSPWNPGATLGIWLAPAGATKGVLVKATDGGVMGMQRSGISMDVYLYPGRIRDSLKLWRFTSRTE